MLKSILATTGIVLLAAVTILAINVLSGDPPTAAAQTPVDMGIDMDVTGNAARTVGTVENCDQIDSAGTNTIDIDIVLPDPGVDAADGISSVQFSLLYDPAVVTVTAVDVSAHLLNQAAGSFLLGLGDATSLPDSDGTFAPAWSDFGPLGIEPAGASEIGPGVLVRITLTGVAQGTSPLSLSSIILANDLNNPIPVSSISQATVSVDEVCVFTPFGPDVRIAGLACNANPERVRIKNFGGANQDLAGWALRSDPVGSQSRDLSDVDLPPQELDVGILAPKEDALVLSDSNATLAPPTAREFVWDTSAKFRDGDATDFAQVVDDTPTEVDNESCVLGDMIEDVVAADGSVSTDGFTLEGNDPSFPKDAAGTDDPVETTVTTPNGGTVRILEKDITQSAPSGSGITLLGQEVSIEAPAASTADPLVIVLQFDNSLIPSGLDGNDIEVFKGGTQVQDCSGAAGTASPDPCISSTELLPDGDAKITILSSTASLWNFGAVVPAATPTPAPTTTTTPTPEATTLPPSGFGEVDGGGSGTLTLLLIALGVAVTIAAVAYTVYGRLRRRAPLT